MAAMTRPLASSLAASARSTICVGTCARALTAGGGAHVVVAPKLGWFVRQGVDVKGVPLTGSTDCVRFAASRVHDDARAFAHERAGDAETDACRRARDDGVQTGESHGARSYVRGHHGADAA
jgi:hypothetical protein